MKNFIVRLLEGFTQLVLGLVRQLLGRWLGPELITLAIILLLAWLVKVLFF